MPLTPALPTLRSPQLVEPRNAVDMRGMVMAPVWLVNTEWARCCRAHRRFAKHSPWIAKFHRASHVAGGSAETSTTKAVALSRPDSSTARRTIRSAGG